MVVLATVALGACTQGLERGAEALSPTAPVSPGATPSSGTDVATGPDGRPVIVVRTPVEGDDVVSGVQVSGTAIAAEGTVTVAILDDDGAPLASATTDVSCGSGCRGRYAVSLAFFVEDRRPGAIAVYETSPESGAAINLVQVPVALVPPG